MKWEPGKEGGLWKLQGTFFIMAELFILFGGVGLLGMTWAFPLLAYCLSKLGRSHNPESGRMATRVTILIPICNEEATLGDTLQSISVARAMALEQWPGLKIEMLIGADGCADKSESIAEIWNAKILSSNLRLGKWGMLERLVAETPHADWVVLADSGVIWPKNFLLRILPYTTQKDIIGLAPTYINHSAGLLEKMSWKLERHFKFLESKSGGPVSLHGATTLYRRTELNRVFKVLGAKNWLNDDIAIPFTLRALFPSYYIRYAAHIEVFDKTKHSPHFQGREFRRRRRMMLGNLQIIADLMPRFWKQSKMGALVLLRRIFRVFWAYWCLLLIAGIGLYALRLYEQIAVLPTLIGCIIAILTLALLLLYRPLLYAGMMSLFAPYYLVRKTEKIVWQ